MTTSPRIFVVDDEPDMQELFRQQFRREIRKGLYDFRFSERAREVLDVLTGDVTGAVSKTILLTDVNIPEMDGLELLERVKRMCPDLPVIVITAYDDKGTTDRATGLGAETLVSKPVDFTVLKTKLTDILNADGFI